MYNNQKRPVSASLGAFIIAAIDRVVNIFLSNQMILPFFIDNAQQFLVKKSLRHINVDLSRLLPGFFFCSSQER